MGVKLWMVFEAVAPSREDLENSLHDHVEQLETENGVEVSEKEYDEIKKVKDPHPGLEEGFSQVCELRIEVDGFARAVQICINYGPTYVQMEGPEKLELDLKESQDALQNVVDTMHQYAQMGVGGVLVSRNEENG